jgi:hypothetical protein
MAVEGIPEPPWYQAPRSAEEVSSSRRSRSCLWIDGAGLETEPFENGRNQMIGGVVRLDSVARDDEDGRVFGNALEN